MPTPSLTKEYAQQAVDTFLACIKDGFRIDGAPSARTEAARRLKLNVSTLAGRLRGAEALGIDWHTQAVKLKRPVVTEVPSPPTPDNLPETIRALLVKRPHTMAELTTAARASIDDIHDAVDYLVSVGCNIIGQGNRYEIPKQREAAWVAGAPIQIMSNTDNTFTFGACGDQHIGSKYHREDVMTDLYRRYEKARVQAVFNTGNWIDGEASFNRYDILAHGLDGQTKLLAETYPKAPFPTYAVAGDDHEGWYSQREGIDVGRYAESIMREAGHNWHNLGYMEAHVELVNANTGSKATMAVVHPGGGSAYALSYAIQKIIESYEGGEKPAVGLFGHYHKMESALVRNVWTLQTGCAQDQTPFMRKKRLEAHVGGALVKLEQDPESGAIIGFTPSMFRYFNRAWYAGTSNGRWSKHGPVNAVPRSIGGL